MRKKVKTGVCKAAQLRDGSRHPFGMLGGVTALGGGELEETLSLKHFKKLRQYRRAETV